MTTRTTELAAQLTADASGLTAAFQKAQREARDLSKASQDASRSAAAANQRVADSFDLTVDKARKAAAGVTGVSQALFALNADGSSRVLALGAAVGNVAELFGPAGALVTGIGVASSAIVALFLQAREEAKRTAIEIQNEIRSLSSSKDLAGLSRRQAQIFSGDTNFPLAGDNASAEERRRARGIGEFGGLLGLEPKIKAAREELQRLQLAFREANAASAAVSAPGSLGIQIGGDAIRSAREALNELVATQRQLQAEYELTGNAVAKLTPRVVSQTQTTIEQAEAAKRAAAASKENTAALAKNATELERAKKAAEEEMLRAAARAIETASRQIVGLIDDQEKLRKTIQETEKEELRLGVARKERLEGLEEEVEAAKRGAEAYQTYLKEREREAFIEEEVAKSRELAAKKQQPFLDGQVNAIREQAGKTFDLRQEVNALTEAFGQGQLEVGELAEGLSQAASAAAGIAIAFGESGRRLSALIGQTSQLLTNLSRAQKAGIFTGADGKQKDVGLLGALGGKAGAGGVTSAVTSVLGVVGAVGAIAGALSAFGAGARQRAAEIAEATKAFNEGISNFRKRALGQDSQVGQSLEDASKEFKALLDEAAKKNGGFATLKDQVELSRLLGADQLRIAKDFFGGIDDALSSLQGDDTAAQLRQLEIATREREASVRALLEAGVIGPDEMAQSLEKVRAIFDLTKQQIEETAAAAAAAQARVREAFGLDLTARERLLAGDDRGAFLTRQEISQDSARQQARELLEAGTITGEMFERLARILDGELAAALEDFDATVASAAQRVQDDIALRTLVAQGRNDEAEALRQEIANREELREITDETVRAQIEQLQQIELAAAEVAALLEEAAQLRAAARDAARNRVDLFDLEGIEAFSEVLNGYGQAFSGLFAAFDLQSLDGISAAKDQLRAIFTELSGLSDDEVFQRFGLTRDELVSALLETDSGLESLAGKLQGLANDALAAAQATAAFTDTLQDEYLRSQGRGKDADESAALAKRNARIKQAQQLQLGDDTLAQIEAIYQADLAEIAARYATALESSAGVSSSAPVTADRTRARARAVSGGIRQEFGALSEVTGQTLAGLLREVAINTGRSGAIVEALLGRGAVPSLAGLSFPSYAPQTVAGGGIYINVGGINIGALNPAGLTPEGAANEMINQLMPQLMNRLGREVGRLASAEVQFLGGSQR